MIHYSRWQSPYSPRKSRESESRILPGTSSQFERHDALTTGNTLKGAGMQIGTMATATFSFILGALRQFKQPPARSSVKPPLHKNRDEFLEIRNRELDELKRDHFLETRVGQIQSEFEFRLKKTIFWRDAYVYRHLMSKWFCALYENSIRQSGVRQVRSLWLNYLSLLEQVSVSQLLSIQSNNEDVRASYRLSASEDRKSYMTIENAFARQIGERGGPTIAKNK